jgi:hypothetical protein
VKISPAFVDWAFLKPSHLRDWQFGLTIGGELVAAVVAVPFVTRVEGREARSGKVVCFACNGALTQKSPRVVDRIIGELRNRVRYRGREQIFYKYHTAISDPLAAPTVYLRKLDIRRFN